MSPTPDWRASMVAPEGTHHLRDGAPLYEARFLEVLKFHAPGLAPARDPIGMFHIDTLGRPAYEERFRRAFGFYEGLAAVDAGEAGWLHIHPDGSPGAERRWAWSGNFQGGRCTVRDQDGTYLHIRPDGAPAYAARWRYAGDFRDGLAVVQGEAGRSTHIDDAGRLIHGRWFLDLDVFHKGYARARDEGGWMHVDSSGTPAYARRFAAVEPFYNGQARVEREDGGLEVIDEAGQTLVELRPALRSALHAVSADLVSFWRCETIFAAIRAGAYERLPLARAAVSVPLARLLDALGELGLVECTKEGWAASPKGALLREDHADSLVEAARYWSTDGKVAWGQLDRALQDPTWRPVDPFAAAAPDPAKVASLHAMLAPYAQHDYADLARALDPGHRRLVDAGGGSGALAAQVALARPGLVAVVLDRPEVASLGRAPEVLRERLTFQGGDLFSPWPARGDAIMLARVLHDWDDPEAFRILQNARGALEPGGRVYVVELIRAEPGFAGALLSLHMLVSTGGRERTLREFNALSAAAGLRLVEVRPLAGPSQVLVLEAG